MDTLNREMMSETPASQVSFQIWFLYDPETAIS
jgi:hypothetical protein